MWYRVLAFLIVFVLPGGLGLVAGWFLVRAWLVRRRARRALDRAIADMAKSRARRTLRSYAVHSGNTVNHPDCCEPETPRLILSPLDAQVFVEALAMGGVPEKFEGKGGASGGAGASGAWESTEETREPVAEPGPEDPARAVEADAVAEREVSTPDQYSNETSPDLT